MTKSIFLFLLPILILTCSPPKPTVIPTNLPSEAEPSLMVLGIAQDAGFPQIGCKKSCCQSVWNNTIERKMVSCLGLVDPLTKQTWIFDATPDFKDQHFRLLHAFPTNDLSLAGIFLSHAHIGHYTGLMHLGREAMGAKEVPVYAMPRMVNFLSNNGPWSQLVELKNIQLNALKADSTIQLNAQLRVTPLQVPHRDEFSETIGFFIESATKKALFIPDIDKWKLWNQDILAWIQRVDYAFLDGSFYQNGEIPGRDMSEIPHPFMEESMALFKTLSTADKAKVQFIHFNHTNPVLQKESPARNTVIANGFKIAQEGEWVEMN